MVGQQDENLWASLSAAERELALLIRRGLARDEIAREAGLGRKDLQEHLNEIYRKVNVSDPLGLALFVSGYGTGPRSSRRNGGDPSSRVSAG